MTKEDDGDDFSETANAPSIEKVTGKVYTRITPAVFTRQLSAYASRNRLYSFNLTNFNGINPNNIPDDFEAGAIFDFRSGNSKAVSRIEERKGHYVFRINITQNETHLIVSVSDQGPGIAPEHQEKVFQKANTKQYSNPVTLARKEDGDWDFLLPNESLRSTMTAKSLSTNHKSETVLL